MQRNLWHFSKAGARKVMFITGFFLLAVPIHFCLPSLATFLSIALERGRFAAGSSSTEKLGRFVLYGQPTLRKRADLCCMVN